MRANHATTKPAVGPKRTIAKLSVEGPCARIPHSGWTDLQANGPLTVHFHINLTLHLRLFIHYHHTALPLFTVPGPQLFLMTAVTVIAFLVCWIWVKRNMFTRILVNQIYAIFWAQYAVAKHFTPDEILAIDIHNIYKIRSWSSLVFLNTVRYHHGEA
jgi:hypothetical protein